MHASADASGRNPDIRVELDERSYDIHIGAGLLAHSGRLLTRALGARRCFVITNPAIAHLHGETLQRGLADVPSETITVPAGERQKSVRRAERLWDELTTRGADRQSAVIAFGGGVIGDLAGFVAATYMRGVPYVQVPTSLLAQVDSSVGGKVAVNRPQGKNLVGAFYQPRLVIADVAVLKTLRAREYRSGLAEVIKHAVIADPDFFDWMRRSRRAVQRREVDALIHIVRRCCEIKAEIVRRDERETGLRSVLNLGHTVGHALEALQGYGALRHGEAVAIGMAAAARTAQLSGMLPVDSRGMIEDLLEAYRLPTRVPGLPIGRILVGMERDKKALGGVLRLVLPRAIGCVEIVSDVQPEIVRRALDDLGAVD